MNDQPTVHGTLRARETGSDTFLPMKVSQSYLAMARSHIEGVNVMAAANPTPSVSLALVAGFVAENALKAYLYRSGDDKRLKNPAVWHDLMKLRGLARNEGLPILEQPPPWFVNLGRLHNRPFDARYATGKHVITTPASEPMATELATLVELVAKNL